MIVIVGIVKIQSYAPIASIEGFFENTPIGAKRSQWQQQHAPIITGAILFVPFLVKNAVSFFSVPKLPSLCKSPGTGATAKVKLSFRARHKWN